MCLFPNINISKLGINFITATPIPFSTLSLLSLNQYFDFNTATVENLALYKYEVPNSINIRSFVVNFRIFIFNIVPKS